MIELIFEKQALKLVETTSPKPLKKLRIIHIMRNHYILSPQNK